MDNKPYSSQQKFNSQKSSGSKFNSGGQNFGGGGSKFSPRPVSSGARPVSSGPQKVFGNQRTAQSDFNRGPRMVFINEQIKAPNIIIIQEDGENLGTFPRLRALQMAEDAGLDLVQIHYDQEKMVSTVKLVDYGRYMYQKQKDEKEKKKNQKITSTKELKFGYAIGENDLQLKVKKARELLQDGYSVKFIVKLKGREKIYADKTKERLMGVQKELADVGRSQYEHPKQEAQGYSIILFPKAH